MTERLLDEWENLLPRWRAVTLTLKAESEVEENDLPWIDCKFFVAAKQGVAKEISNVGMDDYVIASDYMGSEKTAQYKYQIELGGAGGTTWNGTISKLAIPGLLFHHETPMKDWFFDDLKPWVHYIPIEWDLSDLREKFEWAAGLLATPTCHGITFSLNSTKVEYDGFACCDG